MERNDISTVLFEIKGDDISIDKAPAELIGNVLLNFQGLIFSLGQYFDHEGPMYGRRAKRIEEKYTLKVSFEKGSIALRMSPYYDHPVLYPPEGLPHLKTKQEYVFYKLRELLVSLQGEEEDYRSKVENLVPNHIARFKIFNYLNELLPKNNIQVNMTFFDSPEQTTTILMDKAILKNRISSVLREEAEKDRIEIEGVIVRLKDDSPDPVFWVKTFDSKLSKVTLPRERRPKVIKYLSERVPIRLFGVGTKKKHAEIVEIDEIEEKRELIIDSVGDNPLKEPIAAEVSFEKYDDKDDFWVVGNKELGVVGVDDTVEKARTVFEEDLYEYYQFYKGIPDNELTERTMRIKKKLIQIFG
ncbi:MAG: hypothetical protein AYK18_16980 [Theionarchaea archaeon DG-70]|nr:MAG: hypothetical protein AYK18_16980 [Theionarchaea archaeon DG-70]